MENISVMETKEPAAGQQPVREKVLEKLKAVMIFNSIPEL